MFNFLKSLFAGDAAPADAWHGVTVRCRQCGEIIEANIHLRNDLSLQDDGTYRVNKTLMGENLCFERIEISLIFDQQRQLIDQTIQRGAFIEPEAASDDG